MNGLKGPAVIELGLEEELRVLWPLLPKRGTKSNEGKAEATGLPRAGQ